MTVKSSISLTDQQDKFARSLVQEGRFSSLSSVVQQGLDLLQNKTAAEQMENEALRVLLSQRQHGEFIAGSAMESKIKQIAAAKAHKKTA